MSNIKNNNKIIKIIKWSGTSFQPPRLSQKHVRNVCHTALSTQDSKEIRISFNFYCVAVPMMTSQISNSVNFTKTQKSRYLKNEALFFLQIKKIINYLSRATFMAKYSFVAEVTFNFEQISQLFLLFLLLTLNK